MKKEARRRTLEGMVEAFNPDALPDLAAVVVGDIILDVSSLVESIGDAPESPGTLRANDLGGEIYGLGGAGNVANNLVSIGNRTVAFGTAGTDPQSRVLARCATNPLLSYVVTKLPALMTTVRTRFFTVSKHSDTCRTYHQLFRLDRHKVQPCYEVGDWRPEGFPGSVFATLLKHKPVVCLVNYDKGVFSPHTLYELRGRLDGYQGTVLVDPGKEKNWLSFCPSNCPSVIFKVNAAQLYAAFPNVFSNTHIDGHRLHPEEDYRHFLRVMWSACSHPINCHAVVVTLGAGGIAVLSGFDREWDENSAKYWPATTQNAVDVCGAGDNVMAVLANCFAPRAKSPIHRQLLWSATELANKAAGYAVQQPGVYVLTSVDVFPPEDLGKPSEVGL